MNWQPIETAPKDRTEVLCWREDCGPFIASYTSADSFPLTQAEIDSMDEESLFHKDWFTQWPQAFRLDGSEVPTHWMPLPAAPGAAPASPTETAPDIDRAAKKLAELFDYPWEHMLAEGRQNMRKNVEAVLLAAAAKESP